VFQNSRGRSVHIRLASPGDIAVFRMDGALVASFKNVAAAEWRQRERQRSIFCQCNRQWRALAAQASGAEIERIDRSGLLKSSLCTGTVSRKTNLIRRSTRMKNIAGLTINGTIIALALITLLGPVIVVQPPLNTFVCAPICRRASRLYFTRPISPPSNNERWAVLLVLQEGESDFGGYVSQRTPDAPARGKTISSASGSVSMCMFYLSK